MNAELRLLVRERADNRCEYCRLRQDHLPFVTFQIEHIRARQHGGLTESTNLALSCDRCNSHKGPNLSGTVQVLKPRRVQLRQELLKDGVLEE